VSVYRCYYTDYADRVVAVDVIHCDTDAEARVKADALLAASGHAAVEIWDRIQVVYRARKAEPPPPE
jgi:hypothetical protein